MDPSFGITEQLACYPIEPVEPRHLVVPEIDIERSAVAERAGAHHGRDLIADEGKIEIEQAHGDNQQQRR